MRKGHGMIVVKYLFIYKMSEYNKRTGTEREKRTKTEGNGSLIMYPFRVQSIRLNDLTQ